MVIAKHTGIFLRMALLLQLGGTLLCAQTTNINTNSSQAGAGNVAAGATNVILYYFTCNVTAGSPSFTAIDGFTTSGTYAASDILNLKIYQTNFESFNTTTLKATLTTGLGAGTHTFTFANGLAAAPSQKYYWITADFSATAVCSNTIKVDLITSAMLTVTGTKFYGTNNAAGLKTISGGGCTLPVELLYFEADAHARMNLLKWATATESNNSHFTVERSADGVNYEVIDRVKGAGNSLVERRYTVADRFEARGPLYYRLSQYDFNGKASTFPVIVVEPGAPGEPTVKPNPSNGIFTIGLAHASAASIEVFSAPGELLFALGGEEEVEIDLRNYSAGFYYVKVRYAAGDEYVRKLCRQ
jgi:hypothetical protein